MGAFQSATKDAISHVSPWHTSVTVKNCTATPVTVLLAHDPSNPSHKDASVYEVPPDQIYGIESGYCHEPKATLIIRTGVDEAKIYHVPNTGRLLVRLSQHGLKVETEDKVEVEDYNHPHDVPAHDTIPMVVHGESFHQGHESEHSGHHYGLEDHEHPRHHHETTSAGRLLGRVFSSGSGGSLSKTEKTAVIQHKSGHRLDAPYGLEQ
eukprot:TRINITY_DN6524_c0_g2_i1.p1 TRINITY_DN6524_c0_g2~~TRINITY_DN6524_c0_g2_i1.p1  ORF type:complete len:208 (+),score=27.17 TRINITY_DN6524_c0_g2_i1:74-697(+)